MHDKRWVSEWINGTHLLGKTGKCWTFKKVKTFLNAFAFLQQSQLAFYVFPFSIFFYRMAVYQIGIYHSGTQSFIMEIIPIVQFCILPPFSFLVVMLWSDIVLWAGVGSKWFLWWRKRRCEGKQICRVASAVSNKHMKEFAMGSIWPWISHFPSCKLKTPIYKTRKLDQNSVSRSMDHIHRRLTRWL